MGEMSPDGQGGDLRDLESAPQNDDDIGDLIAALDRVPLTSNAMTLRELDGFLTGVLVTPGRIPPEEWLPIAWDQTEPSSAPDPELSSDVLLAIRRHYLRIKRGLRSATASFEPLIFTHPVTGEAFWDPWVWGFEDALSLRADHWTALKADPGNPAHTALMNFETLVDIAMGQSRLPDIAMELVSAEAPSLIRDLVLQLNGLRQEPLPGSRPVSLQAPVTRPKRSRPLRRNDRCVCGSGKRYKRCCGAL